MRTRNRAGWAALSIAAIAAVAATAAPAANEVREIDAGAVRAAFAKGVPLLETAAYKIHASRREAPGRAEVHVRDTDLVYVLEGSATIVTGGRVVDGETVAPDEIRGASIEGGDRHALAPGDVLVVPNGVPHQFAEVAAPFLYYVVKVTDAGAAR